MKDPKIVKKGKFVVVGLMYRGKNENQEIAGLWPQLMARFGELKNEIISHESYGVMGNMDDETGEFDYLAGFPVAGEFDAPDGMKTWDVPEQKYAVFPTTLPDLMDTFTKIYKEWMPESGYKIANGPELEYYDETFDPQDESSLLYLYIPVV